MTGGVRGEQWVCPASAISILSPLDLSTRTLARPMGDGATGEVSIGTAVIPFAFSLSSVVMPRAATAAGVAHSTIERS